MKNTPGQKIAFKNTSCEKSLTYTYTTGHVREIIIANRPIFCSSAVNWRNDANSNCYVHVLRDLIQAYNITEHSHGQISVAVVYSKVQWLKMLFFISWLYIKHSIHRTSTVERTGHVPTAFTHTTFISSTSLLSCTSTVLELFYIHSSVRTCFE
jgi:hypothetical protein